MTNIKTKNKTTKMQLGKKIKALREGLGLSQTDLANKTGLHRSQLSSLENENMSPFQDFTKYKLLCNILKADPHKLWEIGQKDRQEWKAKEYLVKANLLKPDIAGKLSPPIPILSEIPSSMPETCRDFPPEIIEAFHEPFRDPNSFFYRAEGDSMDPEIKEGDLVLICPVSADKVKNGDIVAIANGKGARQLRRVTFNGRQTILTADNLAYPVIVWTEQDKPKIIGRVKEIIRSR